MKTKLLLSLSVSALLAFAPQALATSDAASPAPSDAAASLPAPDVSASVPVADPAPAPEAAPTQDATQDATEDAANDAATAATVQGATEDGSSAEAQQKIAEADAAAPAPQPEMHSHDVPVPPQMNWSWMGAFGTFDRASLQRGFQVYRQVCSACHSMNLVYYRNLSALGYNEDEIKAIAADASVPDGPNDEGEMYERPGRPSDHFKAPFANDQAARAANGGALPPDLSLIIRARANGPDYVHGILTGYTEAPAGFALNPGMNYNEYFPGHQIAMPQPLSDGAVTYDDGTIASMDQEARDVVTFLAWASEPRMELRKQTGIKAILFLIVLAGLMYATKRRVWKDLH
ncbi:MAG: cytochrome c1 [Rhodospirillales bacterium]|nr:cytochrome c1 [Alphaproteobacteria bacterium]MCB9987644.1 cytochrome c1 [Rhodospirillales bacterium]USO08057.1 MAG: cytochrome c1 [Rhodospirillales bacterium]